jgi:hypothetical protein
MQELPAVGEARALFTEGKDWSVVRWLAEKRRARALADRATAALDAFERQVKARWSEELKNAYAELTAPAAEDDDPFATAEREFLRQHAQTIPENVRALAKRVKQADDEAYRARMTAEETFAQAERRLSVALSKRGAEQAIQSYDLHYKAIDEAEAARVACEPGA